MRLFILSVILLFVIYSTSNSLDPIRGAVKFTGGGAVAVEVQLYDFATGTNVYPGAGNQSLGSLSANSSGIISFVIGEGDANWTAITASDITNNHMLIVTVDGSVAAYIRLDDLLLQQGKYGTSIGTIVFDTQGNVTSNRLGTMASDDFVFGSDQLDDNGFDYDSRFFFDKSKGAFRAGRVSGDEWDDANVNNFSFAAGYGSTASGHASVVSGGYENTASGQNSVVGGGQGNTASGAFSATVSGGLTNTASGNNSTIAGGINNTANNDMSTVSGGESNLASGDYSTIGGGTSNESTNLHCTIGGGFSNESSENYCTVGGGSDNTANANSAVISGGFGNNATGSHSSVGGGLMNTASGNYSTVSGGYSNTASGDVSTVSGGNENTASGHYSIVSGGYSNTANGNYNFVFGYHVNPTVIEDYRVYFFDALVPGMLAINREDADHPIHVGTDGSNGNGAHLTAGGTWTNGSSITFKDRFADLNDDFVINSIMKLPVKSWHYKGTNEMHIGPFAEDFYTIFGTGDRNSSDIGRYLSTIDVAGVSLRGVQILVEKVQLIQNDNDNLKNQNDELKRENQELRKEIDQIKSMLKEINEKID
jgi:FtsZ-binding cell division protein ZapB